MHIYMHVHIFTEDFSEFTIVLLYFAEKRKGDVSHGGEVSDSGSETCNRTDPKEEDEQDTVVLQLGRSMKDLVLWIVKTVVAEKEEN